MHQDTSLALLKDLLQCEVVGTIRKNCPKGYTFVTSLNSFSCGFSLSLKLPDIERSHFLCCTQCIKTICFSYQTSNNGDFNLLLVIKVFFFSNKNVQRYLNLIFLDLFLLSAHLKFKILPTH